MDRAAVSDVVDVTPTLRFCDDRVLRLSHPNVPNVQGDNTVFQNCSSNDEVCCFTQWLQPTLFLISR